MNVCLRYIYIFVYYMLAVIGVLCYKAQYAYIISFLFSIIGTFLILCPLFGRITLFSLSVLSLFSVSLGGELASVFNTGKLLEVLTLANVTELSSVGDMVIYSSLGILIGLLIAPVFIGGKKKVFISKFIYLLVIPLGTFYFLYDNVRPFTSFAVTFTQYIKQIGFRPEQKIAEEQKNLYGKDWVYRNQTVADIPNLRGKNIVALFTEGLSLNMIDKFNSYSDLTPHMTHFVDNGLWFDNYYGHTAATYRGIRGQLSSSYQYAAGRGKEWNVEFGVNSVELANLSYSSIVFVPQILRQYGYHSYFICAHKAGDNMIKYLETFGFDKVYSGGDFKPENTDLTDGEIFYYLRKLINSGELQEPYFIGFYNLGTHMGFSTKYTVYSNPNGKNSMELNNLHEYDKRFGYFMKKIQDDPVLKKNMAVILTADHAFPPTSDKLDIFHQFRTHFMDTIPLVLWYDGITPRRIDADGKNSLDFAPTLLHWLRINRAHNYFLGCSVYDEDCALPFQYIHNEGNSFYSSKTFKKLHADNGEDAEIIKKIRDFYNLSEYRVFEWNLENNQ